MARTTHDRTLDHRGTELDTASTLSASLAAPTSTASGQTVHQALVDMNAAFRDGGIAFVIGGAGSVITTGIKGDIELPFNGSITAVRLFADQTGSIVIDIWKQTYASYPATVTQTITASAKPTLSSALKAQDTTLTGWTTTFSAGDTLRINVDSVSTVTRVVLAFRIRRT